MMVSFRSTIVSAVVLSASLATVSLGFSLRSPCTRTCSMRMMTSMTAGSPPKISMLKRALSSKKMKLNKDEELAPIVAEVNDVVERYAKGGDIEPSEADVNELIQTVAKTNRSESKKVAIANEKTTFGDDKAPVVADDVSGKHITKIPFSSLDISENTKKALASVLKFEYMTDVQAQSIPEVLKGGDVFVKARTGTGKTLGFLIPAIDVLIEEKARHAKLLRAETRQSGVGSSPAPLILVLSPTRELAQQIAKEADSLCTYHKLTVVTLVGGTNVESDKKALTRPQGVDIVVATPGRLLQHLEDNRAFGQRCYGVRVLVLDEADRLLDMGFKRDIDKIIKYLPEKEKMLSSDGKASGRQTLLFSATFSKEVKEVAAVTLRRGYTVIDTVGEEADQTHAHVPQQMMIVPLGQQIRALAAVLEEQQKQPKHKIMVFFPTAKQTAYMSELFAEIGIKVMEIHSRKTQGYRTRTSEEFRKARSAIMFSSDVTARGMDYPDVTLVVQVGMTTRDQYIHRLGRTARAGKEGSGLILAAPYEAQPLKSELKDMPLVVKETPVLSGPAAEAKFENITIAQKGMKESAEETWAAWLGYYNSMTRKLNWNSEDLVQTSINYAISLGLKEPPALPKRTLAKMGLSNVQGLKSEVDTPSKPKREGGGGGGRGAPAGTTTSSSATAAAPGGGGGGGGGDRASSGGRRPGTYSARGASGGSSSRPSTGGSWSSSSSGGGGGGNSRGRNDGGGSSGSRSR